MKKLVLRPRRAMLGGALLAVLGAAAVLGFGAAHTGASTPPSSDVTVPSKGGQVVENLHVPRLVKDVTTEGQVIRVTSAQAPLVCQRADRPADRSDGGRNGRAQR